MKTGSKVCSISMKLISQNEGVYSLFCPGKNIFGKGIDKLRLMCYNVGTTKTKGNDKYECMSLLW